MTTTQLPLRGIIPPMVTPLIDNDTLDKVGVERLVEHMIAGGIHGLFALGTTGEAPSLSYDIRYQLVELSCKIVNGRIPVLVGITDTSISESLALAEHAARCGAAAVVSAPPYYFAPAQQELIEYYTELADALPLPLYLYNMPSHVKVIFEPQTVRTLSEHPNVAGLKDSSSNMVYFNSLVHIMHDKPEFSLLVGPEELTAECVLLGGHGGVNGGANIFPELYVELYNAALACDIVRVRELQARVMEISTTLYKIGKYGSSFLKGVKCSLSLMGICSDFAAAPFRKFRAEERAKVREILERLGAEIKNP
ncbi:MAG: dihydrodipicolinate synthase family protein [Rikenellaceae bacterium]|nr:dihydrodipicolinate synthase family protein [Rikenellaceae bacterium]